MGKINFETIRDNYCYLQCEDFELNNVEIFLAKSEDGLGFWRVLERDIMHELSDNCITLNDNTKISKYLDNLIKKYKPDYLKFNGFEPEIEIVQTYLKKRNYGEIGVYERYVIFTFQLWEFVFELIKKEAKKYKINDILTQKAFKMDEQVDVKMGIIEAWTESEQDKIYIQSDKLVELGYVDKNNEQYYWKGEIKVLVAVSLVWKRMGYISPLYDIKGYGNQLVELICGHFNLKCNNYHKNSFKPSSIYDDKKQQEIKSDLLDLVNALEKELKCS